MRAEFAQGVVGRLVRYQLHASLSIITMCFAMRLHRFGVDSETRSFARFAMLAILGIATCILLAELVYTALCRIRLLFFAVNVTLLVTYMALGAYHTHQHLALDWEVIRMNWGLAWSSDSFTVICFMFGRSYIIATLGLVILYAIAFWALPRREPPNPGLNRGIRSSVLAVAYGAVLLVPFRASDELRGLFRGVLQSTFERRPQPQKLQGYPFVRDSIQNATISPVTNRRTPTIIFVVRESINALFIQNYQNKGSELDSVWRGLVPQGISVDRFYANSVQTAFGHAAILMSSYPGFRSKISYNGSLRFKALPEYLREAGYKTYFVQAHSDLNFENTLGFMTKCGFDEVRSAIEFIRAGDDESIWGWGIDDGLLYRRALEFLDSHHERHPQQPAFLFLPTISTHMPFEVPENKRHLFEHPNTIQQAYANAVYLADKHLTTLVDGIAQRPYLQDAVLVLTADHSYALNEHGIIGNESGFLEESFRIPFLMLSKQLVKPGRITSPYAQVDIAPTILDLIGLGQSRNHFVGRSMLNDSSRSPPVLLTQPYAGRYLGVVAFPYKYLRHDSDGTEYVFNLEADASEAVNLASLIPGGTLGQLREHLTPLLLAQEAILGNRLW